jgi:aminoglycoside phosphotransferase (APT) family kinase protein
VDSDDRAVQPIREVVRRHLPDQPCRTVVPLGAGQDNVAYLVDGDLVVRRSREPTADQEAQLLAVVSTVVPAPVPVFAEAGWLAYRKLPGTPLLDLPPAVRTRLAPSVGGTLGRMLATLHELTVPVGSDESTLAEWYDETAGELSRTAHLLGPRLRRAVESFLAEPPPADQVGRAFSHNDLGAEHILVDGDTVTGIIDWTDAAYTDPAFDFGLILRDLGPDGLAAALTSYPAVDDGFRQRIRGYAVCKAIEDIGYGLDSGATRYLDNGRAALTRLL